MQSSDLKSLIDLLEEYIEWECTSNGPVGQQYLYVRYLCSVIKPKEEV